MQVAAVLRVAAMAFFCSYCLTAQTINYGYKKGAKYPPQLQNLYQDRLKKPSKTVIGSWSAWSSWTPCSRSCGGGITQQTRHCITRSADPRFIRKQRRRRQTNGCVGLYKRIRLCNNQDCPQQRDFRYEQCAAFNNRPYKGQIYFWEPYKIASDECVLNCRPMGMNFYATLNKTVIDGTECSHPLTNTGKVAPKGTRGLCIDGYCKSVNANGIIGNIDDNQEECSACLKGTCRSINGLYTRPDLPPGYSLVAQIPQGACRILVQQLKHTRNFLALRNANGSFIINGDWKFSNSRTVEGAGTKFSYSGPDSNILETITAPGPLSNPVDIMIVNYQMNPGIKYGYAVAVDQETPLIAPPLIKREPNVEPRRLEHPTQRDEATRQGIHRRTRVRRRFAWKISGVSACSKSCGGGLQATVVTCVREHTQTPVLDRRCAHLEKPNTQPIRCNVKDCPPEWTSSWGPCSTTCGEGVQNYIPQCQQELSTGRTVILTEIACQRAKPVVQTRVCKLTPCPDENELPQTPAKTKDEWTVGSWSSCSATCGTSYRTRSVTCPSGQCHAENRPKYAEYCENEPCSSSLSISDDRIEDNTPSPWLLTDWSQCSESCGTGVQTRRALCGTKNCTDSTKPETTRACSSDKQCGGQWYVGPWSECSDSCNGSAKQKREVLCVVKIRGQAHLTNEMTCPTTSKPGSEQACNGYCKPYHWYSGEWGECECGNGLQKREVKCFDIYGRNYEGCAEGEKLISKRQCSCRKEDQVYKPAQDEPQDRFCLDKIKNCYLAVQARLCQYPYYINHCCASCRKTQQDTLE